MKKQEFNRRNFFKLTGSALLLGSVALWAKLTGRENQLTTKHIFTFPFHPNRKISFAGKFIIVNNKNGIRVFSARCTHLGCMINHVKNDSLVCPCHGSVFDEEGNPVKGPAIKPLETVPFHLGAGSKRITINA